MPKAHRKSGADEDDDIPLHGTTNEEEAKNYSKGLDSIVIQMGVDMKEELQDAMKRVILNYKEVIVNMIPSMQTADPNAVWRLVKDKVGICICSRGPRKDRRGY